MVLALAAGRWCGVSDTFRLDFTSSTEKNGILETRIQRILPSHEVLLSLSSSVIHILSREVPGAVPSEPGAGQEERGHNITLKAPDGAHWKRGSKVIVISDSTTVYLETPRGPTRLYWN